MLLAILTGIFFTFPVLGIPFFFGGYISKNKGQKILGLFFLAMFMGILGYCFQNPKTDPDLVRYIEMTKKYSGLGILESFNAGSYENLFIIDIWFWAIAQTGNYQLVAATTCIFTYLIILYILQDYYWRNNFSLQAKILATVLVMGVVNFAFVVNAIRSTVAFLLVLLAVYREFYKNKKNIWTYLCYIIPIFMHFASILLVVIRFSVIMKKRWIKFFSLALCFVPVYIEFVVKIINRLPSEMPFISYIQSFAARALMYFKWNEGGWATVVSNSGYYKLNKCFSLLVLIITIFVFLKLEKQLGIVWSKEFDSYIMVYFAIIFACFTMKTPTYQRFTVPIWVFCGSVLTRYLEETRLKMKRNKKAMYCGVIIILMFLGYFLNGYMLNSMIPIQEYIRDVFVFNWVIKL